MNFLIFSLLAFSLSSLVSAVLAHKAKKIKKIYRIGGIAIISSFVIALLFSDLVLTSEWQAILIGSISILFFGVLDDFKNFNWKIQIFFQLLLVLILVAWGFEVGSVNFAGNELFRLDYWKVDLLERTFSLMSWGFIFFWLIGIINSVNWMDGSDGLMSVAGILSLLAVILVSLKPEVDQPAFILVSAVAIGSLGGFLIFNFPKAKLEAGTSGSYFVGFLLASLAIAAGTKIATTMIILILPVVDFVWVIFERFKANQSIFKRDNHQRHLHYKLLKKGFSQKQILLGYALFLGIALLISFFVINQIQKIFLLVAEFLMILTVMLKLSNNSNGIKMKNIFDKKPVLILILIIVLILIFSFWNKRSYQSQFDTEQTVWIDSAEIKVKLAQTPEETHQGLSDINKIPQGTGMLFLYNQLSECKHVMRRMKFDLDFVFLRDGLVISTQKDIPNDFEGIISAPEACNQVLEINAGEIDRLGIEFGDVMRFSSESP